METVDFGNRLLFAGFGFKGGAPEPIRVPRPYESEPARRTATVEEMKAFFGGAIEYVPGGD